MLLTSAFHSSRVILDAAKVAVPWHQVHILITSCFPFASGRTAVAGTILAGRALDVVKFGSASRPVKENATRVSALVSELFATFRRCPGPPAAITTYCWPSRPW